MNHSTYRYDPFTDAWRIVAPGRADVPKSTTIAPDQPDPPGPCAFCPGGDREAEPVLHAWPSLDDARVRVLANKFPVVEAAVEEPNVSGGHARPATGWHEILIEGSDHDLDIPKFSAELFGSVICAMRDRVRELEERPGVRQVHLFRNRGRAAGSSQPHPHSQLVATTVLGDTQQRRTSLARAHHRREGRSLLRTQVNAEVQAMERVVEQGETGVVLCPFAPRFNFETWVVPPTETAFSALSDSACHAFADLLRDAVRRVLMVSRKRSYNLLWQLPPARTGNESWSSWHVEIAPRGGTLAGLESLSGLTMVTVTPEEAAAKLRAAL